MQIRPYQPADEEQVIALWHECNLVVPWNDPHEDIQRKQQVQPELFLVGEVEGRVVASVMAGYEGRRGWLNLLAVAPDLQGQGLGRQIVEAAETLLRERGCPKVNLQVRATNQEVIAFYERLGYQVEPLVSMGKRLT
jgi:ribosomal protein S18 acetylase RimI-like enzyme